MIYHVVSSALWQKAALEGFYEAESLAVEGFIHTSKAEQLKEFWNAIMKDKRTSCCCISMKLN